MKLAIFGGSGRTGKPLVERALAGGHDVAILVRDPAKAPAESQHLTVVTGTVRDQAPVEQVIRGAQAVISIPKRRGNRFILIRKIGVIFVRGGKCGFVSSKRYAKLPAQHNEIKPRGYTAVCSICPNVIFISCWS